MESTQLITEPSNLRQFQLFSSSYNFQQFFFKYRTPSPLYTSTKYDKYVNYLYFPDGKRYPYKSRSYHFPHHNKYKSNILSRLFSKVIQKFQWNNERTPSESALSNMINSIFTISQSEKPNSNSKLDEGTHSKKNKLSSSSSEEKTNTSYYSVSERLKTVSNDELSRKDEISILNPSSLSGTRPKIRKNRQFTEGSSSDDVFLPQHSRYKLTATGLNPNRRYKLVSAQSASSESDDLGEVRGSKYPESGKFRGTRSKRSQVVHDHSSSHSVRSKSCTHQKNQRDTSRSNSPPTKNLLNDISDESKTISADMMIINSDESNTNPSKSFDHSFSTIENSVFLKRIEEVLSEIVEEKKSRILQRKHQNQLLVEEKEILYGSFDRSLRGNRHKDNKWVVSKHYDANQKKTNSFSHIITSHGDGRLKNRFKIQ